MDFIEEVWIRQEGAPAGIGAEQDRAAAIFDPRKIGRIGVSENPPAKGDEAEMSFGFSGGLWHQARARVRFLWFLHLRDEHLVGSDRQSFGWFRGFQSLGTRKEDLEIVAFDASRAREIQL